MTAYVSHTPIDCADAFALSKWWKPVVGYADIEDDPNEPGDEECMIRDPRTGHRLLFVEVPDADEAKQRCRKNRLHLDPRPNEGTRDEELEVLLTHGATTVADCRGKYGPAPAGWCSPIRKATNSASCDRRPRSPTDQSGVPAGRSARRAEDDGERWGG